MTVERSTRERAKGVPRPRRTALAIGVTTVLATTLGVSPAAAAEEPGYRQGQVRLCDPTACYVAWRVVDSDQDGTSDADELVAGTDPYDPHNRPSVAHLTELTTARKLPSFEAGRGVFVLLPPYLVELRKDVGIDPLGAFALPTRSDTLSRLGISADLLEQHGLSAGVDGFTIGLDALSTKDGPFEPRISGVQASLISAGFDDPVRFVGNGGLKSSERDWFGDGRTNTYHDGTKDHVTTDPDDGTVRIDRTNSDGSAGTSRVIQERDRMEGDVKVHEKKESTFDADGNLLSSELTTTKESPDGSVIKSTVTTEFIRDENGEVTGTKVTETESYISPDGTYGSSSQTTSTCDANGQNCTETSYEYTDSDDEEYIDPDAANPTIVTQEAMDGVLRTRGAAITVARNWTAPGLENEPENPANPGTVMLVDSTLAEHFLLVEPLRVTKAQPEVRPDLPNPGHAAPPPSGGCSGLC